MIRSERYLDSFLKLSQAITKKDIEEVRKKWKRGYVVDICDIRFNDVGKKDERRIIRAYIQDFYPHLVLFDNGMTCTYQELVMYDRNSSIPIGMHFGGKF